MKNEKLEIIESNEFQSLFDKSKKLIDSARSNMGQMANAITVLTSFLLGRYIVEQEQQGAERAKYGAKVLDSLSSYLTEEYGRGFSRSNVAGMRQFYMAYKDRENEIIQSGIGQFEQAFGIVQSGIGQLETAYIPEGRFLGQQQHRRGGRALPQPAGQHGDSGTLASPHPRGAGGSGSRPVRGRGCRGRGRRRSRRG